MSKIIKFLYDKKLALFLSLIPTVVYFYNISQIGQFGSYELRPLFSFIVHTFLFMFYIIPTDFFLSCGGLGISICLPNPFTIIPIYLINFVIVTYTINSIIKLLRKFESKYVIILSLSSLFLFLISGYFIEQESCVSSFRNGKDKLTKEKYIEKNGVIQIIFTKNDSTILSTTDLENFYKSNGLIYLYGNPNLGAVYFKVKVGEEYSKICKLRGYKLVRDGISPAVVKDITNPTGHRIIYKQYLDSNFCKSGQMDQLTCEKYTKVN